MTRGSERANSLIFIGAFWAQMLRHVLSLTASLNLIFRMTSTNQSPILGPGAQLARVNGETESISDDMPSSSNDVCYRMSVVLTSRSYIRQEVSEGAHPVRCAELTKSRNNFMELLVFFASERHFYKEGAFFHPRPNFFSTSRFKMAF